MNYPQCYIFVFFSTSRFWLIFENDFGKNIFPYNIFVNSTFIVNYINHTNTFIENQSYYAYFKKNAKYLGKKKIIRKMIFSNLIYNTK